MARKKISGNVSYEEIIEQMAEGDMGARLIAQECIKNAGYFGPTELLALDDMGIRGTDLTLAAFAYHFDALSWYTTPDFTQAERIVAVWSDFKNAVSNPKEFRDDKYHWPQHAFDTEDTRYLSGLTCNINLDPDRRGKIAKLMNDAAGLAHLREILPELPERSKYPVSESGHSARPEPQYP